MNEEQKDQSVDIIPLTEELQAVPAAHTMPSEKLEQTIERAEKFMGFLQRMIQLAVGMTNHNDWVDQNGTPYLEASGCSKIARGFGISIADTQAQKITMDDEAGQYYVFKTSINGTWQGNSVTEIGTCSTRDKFFAQRNGKHLPLSEIDITNVMKKSHTNAMNRLTKRLLGLSFTWEEIAEASNNKITQQLVKEKGRGVNYNKGARGGNTDTEDLKKRKAELAKGIMAMAGNDKDLAQKWLEQETAWTDKEGKDHAGKKSVQYLSEKQLPFVERALKAKQKEIEETLSPLTMEQ